MVSRRLGSGSDDGDALRRELREELGVEAGIGERMLIIPASGESGPQWIYRAALRTIDPGRRCGPEFDDPSRGAYTVEHVRLDDLPALNLLPEEAKRLLLSIRS
ncbi:hypothetical protein [Microbacterium sp.]|uniref:hypothetical protein n=1 Tax=Microbacterium sp. TaxID=51671 RepID=UPI0039E62F3E